MITVVWGSKNVAKRVAYFHREEIDCFVDNDSSRWGKVIDGKPILNPSEISNWENAVVYVPEQYKVDILPQVRSYGVKEENIKFYSYTLEVPLQLAKENFEKCIQDLRDKACRYRNKKLVIVQNATYMNEYLYEYLREREYVVLWINKDNWDNDDINFPYILNGAYYINNHEAEWMPDSVGENSLFQNEISQMIEEYHVTKGSANAMARAISYYWEMFIQYVQPQGIVLPAAINSKVAIMDKICAQNNILHASMHFGVFVGTLCIDVHGEVGRSVPAVWSREFRMLPVAQEDLERASVTWKNHYQNKLNRKRQPHNNIVNIIREKMKKDRPVVFFAAQNDVNSYMVPYTEETRMYNSPIFQSSIEAGIFLANLCKKNDWNFIYKAHPMYVQKEQINKLPGNAIFIEYADINSIIDISDVVVTILSNTSYDALFRYKPVVMLGYNWLKNQGCTYDAFEENKIEDEIKNALKYGFSEEMQQAFTENIARMLKYYLYNGMNAGMCNYGKAISDDFNEFYQLQKLLTPNG